MNTNIKGSELTAVLAEVQPISQGAGTVTTSWINISQFYSLLAIISTGIMGASGTVDAKLQQATSAAGAGAKDVTGKAITQLQQAASGSNVHALINLRGQELDTNGGFNYVRLSITVGTAASLIAAKLLGLNPVYMPASANNDAAVVQVVG